MRKGFSLSETVISAAVVLTVALSLTISAGYFIEKRTLVETRRDILTLARITMTDYETMDELPEDGTYLIESPGGLNSFTVETEIATLSNTEREIRVLVTSESGGRVELVRRIYAGTN